MARVMTGKDVRKIAMCTHILITRRALVTGVIEVKYSFTVGPAANEDDI